MRPYGDYGAVVFRGREDGGESSESRRGHRLPAAGAGDREILPDAASRRLRHEETLEIFAFMDAAQRSKEEGGKPVTLR